MRSRAVAERLFVERGGEVLLVAARHRGTGRLRFPFPDGPEAEACDEAQLGPAGTLWSWTVQRFRPKPPYDGRGGERDFTPYGVGYVEFAGQLIVEGRIVAGDFAGLRIGQPMRVVTEAYREDADGAPVLTYAFAPA